MASSGKKKTTMAKLTRESKLRERRLDKQAKRNARKQASADSDRPSDALDPADAESAQLDPGQAALETVAQAPPDA